MNEDEKQMHDVIANRYGFHPARNDKDKTEHLQVRILFQETALELERLLPDGREKSLAHTALQEASMWANAALALNRPLED